MDQQNNQREELRLQSAINTARGHMLDNINKTNANFFLGLTTQKQGIERRKGSVADDQQKLELFGEDPFRYDNPDRQFKADQKLRRKILGEEQDIRRDESVIRAKEEVQKLLSNEKIEKDFDPSIGCSIKWK